MPDLPLLKCAVDITHHLRFTLKFDSTARTHNTFLLTAKDRRYRYFSIWKRTSHKCKEGYQWNPCCGIMVGALGDVRCYPLAISISSIPYYLLFSIWRSPCFSAVILSPEANLGLGKCWLGLFESLMIIVSLMYDIMEVGRNATGTWISAAYQYTCQIENAKLHPPCTGRSGWLPPWPGYFGKLFLLTSSPQIFLGQTRGSSTCIFLPSLPSCVGFHFAA
jgi:hypothetical protein